MVASREINGEDEWPELDSSVELPRAEDLHSDREYAQAYATIAIHHGQTYRRIVHALEYLRGHVVGARGEAALAAKKATEAVEGVRLLRESFAGKRAAEELGLPPMRPEAPSTIDMAESIKKKISGEFGKIARETTGPHIETDPKRLIDVVGKAVDEELAKRERERKTREDAEELESRRQADADAKKNRRKIVRVMVLAFAGAVATAAGTWTVGKATGHGEGVAEESRRHGPPSAAATSSAMPAMPAAK